MRILIVAQRPSDYNEMQRAIHLFSQKGYECYFLYVIGNFDVDQHALSELHALLSRSVVTKLLIQVNRKIYTIRAHDSLNEQLEALQVESKPATRQEQPPIGGFFRKAVKKLRHLIRKFCILTGISLCIYMCVRIKYILTSYFVSFTTYRRLMTEEGIDLLILPEDIVGLVTPLLIAAARKLDKPSFILPYTICNQEEAFQSLKNEPNYSVKLFSNWLMGKLFPRWIMTKDNISVIRLPAPYVLGHVLTRTSPPDPWMMNSSHCNVIAVETQKMFEYYRAAGIRSEKMQVVGALYDDVLAKYVLNKRSERAALYAELNLVGDKPLIVIGGCPNQTTCKVPRFDFADMDEVVPFFAKTFSNLKEKFHIMMRPHPNYLEWADQFRMHGFVTTLIATDRLIGLADVYISFASATIRWAIACGVPVINYDIFHYDYSDYKNVAGVMNVTEKEEFIAAVNLLEQPAELIKLKTAVQTVQSEWGMLDGKSGERICQLVESLCAG